VNQTARSVAALWPSLMTRLVTQSVRQHELFFPIRLKEEARMNGNKRPINTELSEDVLISVFKDIHIHFPGDVYFLAVWVALSDRAKSSPTSESRTTLSGLANKFSSLYGIDYSNPMHSDDVMAIFRRHGIKGNPCLRFGDEDKPPSSISLR
jgi:hypothetical protein